MCARACSHRPPPSHSPECTHPGIMASGGHAVVHLGRWRNVPGRSSGAFFEWISSEFCGTNSAEFLVFMINAAENCQTAVRGLTTSHTRSPAEKHSRFGSEWVPPLSRSRDLPNFSKNCKKWCTASKKELILGVQSSALRFPSPKRYSFSQGWKKGKSALRSTLPYSRKKSRKRSS